MFVGFQREALETFLGGMETGLPRLALREVVPLETFLGGMETAETIGTSVAVLTLKPSLVEWKHNYNIFLTKWFYEP